MPDERNDRPRLAREAAGLSIAQAARMLGILSSELTAIEDPAREHVERCAELARLYGVTEDWLRGAVPLRDYAAIDCMRGADKLSFHDRDVLAQFAASLGKRRGDGA